MTLPNLAQELKQMIFGHLNPYPHYARKLSRALHTKFTDEQMYKSVWDLIFEDYSWIRSAKKMGLLPMLVGHDLYSVWYGPAKRSCYLVLVHGDMSDVLRYERPKILDCLKPHHFNKETNEVTFKDSNIVLNIDGQIRCDESIIAPPTRIFSKRAVSSAALVWGETSLRKIPRRHVGGVRPKVNLSSVSALCYVELSDKNWRWDQLFKDPACPAGTRFAQLPNPWKRPVD
jgi:hypothetical protein